MGTWSFRDLALGEVKWITPIELASRWRRSPRTLERWRATGKGPTWVRLHGRILYPLEEVITYENSCLAEAGEPSTPDLLIHEGDGP